MYILLLKILKCKHLEAFNSTILNQAPFYPIATNSHVPHIASSHYCRTNARNAAFCPSQTESTSEDTYNIQINSLMVIEVTRMVEWQISGICNTGQMKFSNKNQKKLKGQGFTQTLTQSANKSLPTIKYTHSLTSSIE